MVVMIDLRKGPKVIGHITLPDAPIKHKCVCDDCKDVLDDSCGDPRVRITSHYADGSKSERFICPNCDFMQYQDHEPINIFDGTPDWMRML